MRKELETKYNPKEMEDRIYKDWADHDYFHAKVDQNKEPFTIVIPPPNVTGQLHMGHALDETLQDILIRTKRMQGYSTLWLPGTDHASISTEVKVVDKLLSEGIKKEDITREEFLKHAWQWKETYESRILSQLKKLGSSCDWSRTRFTMDDGLNNAVLEFFIKLYDEGLIYRGKKLINWCSKCKTTISDAEVEYVEREDKLYYIQYQVEGTNDFLTVATTRPETMFGDTAVAINEEDERYKKFHGKNVILPIVNKTIPIVLDPHADPEFGTGVVKITPGHDPNDYEVGLRHNLSVVNVLNDDGTMNKEAGKYKDMDRYTCRKKVIEDLKKEALLVKEEPITHSVGVHDRCSDTVEPMVKLQWFVSMEKLAKPAFEVYEKEALHFVPDRFGKIYTHWLTNIKDWCISRQLWWGHRIPAYYCADCDHIMVQKEKPTCCSKCGSKKVMQDEDVLDTWFSSALWPFSTLGWPEETEDYKYFFPTSVLVTGYDIIFFWVVRMVFSSLKMTGKSPFRDVLIHGLVRDPEGRKMSKSLGNGVDPLEIIDQYGADALRMSLVYGNAPGNDMRFYIERVETSRNFANKIWNATRFIMMNEENVDYKKMDLTKLELSDRWILGKLNCLIPEVTAKIDAYEFGMAVEKIQSFLWDEYCDWYIEMVKPRLREEGTDSKKVALWTLDTVLEIGLKLLHPFMPFITEEIFRTITDEESIMISSWPETRKAFEFDNVEEHVEEFKKIITEIRNVRAVKNIPPSKKIHVLFLPEDKKGEEKFGDLENMFITLANIDKLEKTEKEAEGIKILSTFGNFILLLEGLIDKKAERVKLEKELKRLEEEMKFEESKLSNPGFTAKAPAKVIEEEKQKLAKYGESYKKVKEEYEKLL